MKKINYKDKGITLVALVITIIILLILTGVTLNTALSENGLFQMAKKSVKSYDTASEKETLSFSIVNYNISNNEEDKIGEKLSKKDVSNPNWHMIQDEENTYADGWYFIKQGDKLPNGSNAKNNWVINYGTGEVKQLKEKYASMSLGDSVAVKDGLVLNIDTAMMDTKEGVWTQEEIEKALGNNVELHNFDKGDLGTKSGFSSEGFLFDGEDDYISISNNMVLDNMFDNGFTFEFSGVWNGAKLRYDSKEEVNSTNDCALLSIENQIPENSSPFAITRRYK